ncbi:MAG: tryptophan--tRNA ligase [Patescibacteria group bacterium]|nr:tryptophan--tRNA ligase [Patescibacteria group bacterium]
MAKEIIFSGIKPSGVPTLGNYVGAISKWAELQQKYRCFFSVVDLHAITVSQDPKELRYRTYLTTAIMLAAGIDPKKSVIFVQSHVPAHSELAWLINTQSTMGELSRMTQFKDAAAKTSKTSIGAGLFTYPTLMAADILLYDAHVVPVGDDQKQHVELARDLAQKFNHRFGKTFVVPKPLIRDSGARIMDLQNPDKKMSKSDDSDRGYILITDSPDIIRKKIMSAVTDSGRNIVFNKKHKGLYNLLTIYQVLSGQGEKQIEKHFLNKGYGQFKQELAELIIKTLSPMQTQINAYMKNTPRLDKILAQGARQANQIADLKLKEAYKKVGLVTKR